MTVTIPQPDLQLALLMQGFSYWRVKLKTGRTFSELDTSFDFLRGTRPVDWKEDIVGSGDNNRIAELTLCTPVGDVDLTITAPYTAFQLKRGFMSFGSERLLNAQIIGRLEDRETGRCTVHIWDVLEQKLYQDWQTYVGMPGFPGFGSWRDGVIPIGALSLKVVGLEQ